MDYKDINSEIFREPGGNRSHWKLVNDGDIVVHTSAEMLWQQAVSYFKWCDENPVTYKRVLTSGKEAGKKVVIEAPRPYTIKGLCLHCGILEEYLSDVRMMKEKGGLYYVVVSRIMYTIHVQITEYTMVGVFNPIFAAKLLNIETDDTPARPVKVEIITQGIPALSNSESEILEKLELENPLFGKPKEK